ncbi:MAG: phenylacetate--CoA ligase family protein [Acidimicrobiales bacterium]
MATYGGQLGPVARAPEQQFWDPDAQTMPRDQLVALQIERLRAMVQRVLDGAAPLFGRKLAEAGIESAEDITSVDDVSAIPLTVKQDLRDSEATFPPFGDYRFTDPGACVRLGTSTGTTGTPTIALLTRKDIWIEYESGSRAWWRNGWRPGQVVTHAHPAYLYGGGLMLSGTLEYFGLLNLWVAPPETDELAQQGLRMWERVRPDVSMVAFSLGRFVEVAAKEGGEPNLPAFRLSGGGGRGLPLITAGLECYAYLGGAGPDCVGAHLHEDWAVVQAVDPRTGRDVPDGEWGNLVVTTLDRDNGLLRYDLEEAASLVREPCGCGETSIRGFWGGRFKDLLAVQGKHVPIGEIECALRSVEAVTLPTLEYVVVKPVDEAAPLRVRVELVDGDPDVVAADCAGAIRTALGLVAEVEVVDRETLARSGYKATRLVDD